MSNLEEKISENRDADRESKQEELDMFFGFQSQSFIPCINRETQMIDDDDDDDSDDKENAADITQNDILSSSDSDSDIIVQSSKTTLKKPLKRELTPPPHEDLNGNEVTHKKQAITSKSDLIELNDGPSIAATAITHASPLDILGSDPPQQALDDELAIKQIIENRRKNQLNQSINKDSSDGQKKPDIFNRSLGDSAEKLPSQYHHEPILVQLLIPPSSLLPNDLNRRSRSCSLNNFSNNWVLACMQALGMCSSNAQTTSQTFVLRIRPKHTVKQLLDGLMSKTLKKLKESSATSSQGLIEKRDAQTLVLWMPFGLANDQRQASRTVGSDLHAPLSDNQSQNPSESQQSAAVSPNGIRVFPYSRISSLASSVSYPLYGEAAMPLSIYAMSEQYYNDYLVNYEWPRCKREQEQQLALQTTLEMVPGTAGQQSPPMPLTSQTPKIASFSSASVSSLSDDYDDNNRGENKKENSFYICIRNPKSNYSNNEKRIFIRKTTTVQKIFEKIFVEQQQQQTTTDWPSPENIKGLMFDGDLLLKNSTKQLGELDVEEGDLFDLVVIN